MGERLVAIEKKKQREKEKAKVKRQKLKSKKTVLGGRVPKVGGTME